MSIRRKILYQIEAVAAEHKRNLAPLHDDLLLKESGLDSLCFAVVVVNLADDLGHNPFAVSDDTAIPVTIGELVELYEKALASA
jgi:hypothetical protein